MRDSLEILLAEYKASNPGNPLGYKWAREKTIPKGTPDKRNFYRNRWKHTIRRDPCSYCGSMAGTADHIIPKSQTRRFMPQQWNEYTAACRQCNSTKGSRKLLFFLLERG